MGRHHLIIDGYNVMHAHPEYRVIAEQDIDAARTHLISDLTMLSDEDSRTVVVFDGGGNPFSDGVPHRIGAVIVVFSPAGVTADTVIEALAQRAREREEAALVVTSDVATRDAVRAGTVSVRSAESFVEDIRRAGARYAEEARTVERMTVAERIDPRVRDVLARWARAGRP